MHSSLPQYLPHPTEAVYSQAEVGVGISTSFTTMYFS